MTNEHFIELKNKAAKMPPLKLGEIGQHNINVLKHRIVNKFEWAVDDFNRDGNAFKTTEEAEEYIIDLLRCNALTDEEWNKLLPHINVFDFNKEYDEAMKKLIPLINELIKNRWDDDLHLEFWQGALSNGKHWANPKCDVNSPENGKKYIKIIKQMGEILSPLFEKWGYSANFTFDERIDDIINHSEKCKFSWNF